mgnify:CR=1
MCRSGLDRRCGVHLESATHGRRQLNGRLPKEVRAALIKAAASGGTIEQRIKKIDAIMAKARCTYPNLLKED